MKNYHFLRHPSLSALFHHQLPTADFSWRAFFKNKETKFLVGQTRFLPSQWLRTEGTKSDCGRDIELSVRLRAILLQQVCLIAWAVWITPQPPWASLNRGLAARAHQERVQTVNPWMWKTYLLCCCTETPVGLYKIKHVHPKLFRLCQWRVGLRHMAGSSPQVVLMLARGSNPHPDTGRRAKTCGIVSIVFPFKMCLPCRKC